MNLAMLATLVSVAYGFGPATKLEYDVTANFEGFLPVLGGSEGVVNVDMKVAVTGLAPDGVGRRASSEVTAFELTFNGAQLPLGLENAQQFFPKTTISLTPQGQITKNDAPNVMLPVRLPGLDVRRFPDITYVPIEFPAQGVEPGRSWEFTKQFGESELSYTCQATEVTEDSVTVAVSVRQDFTVLENDALEVVKVEADGVNRVRTVMTGTGTVVFDRNLGATRSVRMTNSSVSTVTPKTGGPSTERKLVTRLTVKLASPALAADAPGPGRTGDATLVDRVLDWWESAVATGRSAVSSARGYLTLLRMAVGGALGMLPGPLSGWIATVRDNLPDWIPLPGPTR